VRKFIVLTSLFLLVILLPTPLTLASPLINLQSQADFQAAIDAGKIKPQTTAGDDLLAHYPGSTFAVAELHTYTPVPGDGISDPDGGMVMGWGDGKNVEYCAQWLYGYKEEDPSLIGLTLTAQVFAPNGINSISVAIIDNLGFTRSWDWNVTPAGGAGPLFNNVKNTVSITVAGFGMGGPGEATPVATSFFDNGVNPATITTLGADENGNWVRFTQLNPVTGQPGPWNYWYSWKVVPEPATIGLLALGALVFLRKRSV
jgi:hypothetical protein